MRFPHPAEWVLASQSAHRLLGEPEIVGDIRPAHRQPDQVACPSRNPLRQGATHSHSRRALAEGLSAEELEHVAFLAITTLGWPQAIRALTWIRDVTRGG